jgi:large subunit ribosomal protein L10
MSNLEKNRVAKQVIVDEIKERLERTKSVVLINSRGLTVGQDNTLRKTLRKAGGIDYKVYKNTMMERAIEGTAFEGLKQYLEGPTAVAFSYEDATAAAGQISKLLKGMPVLEFKASAIDGEIYDAAATKAIAEIPSREVLLSRLLGSLKSPMASFARLVNAIAEKDPSESTNEVAVAVTETPVAEETTTTVEETVTEVEADTPAQ